MHVAVRHRMVESSVVGVVAATITAGLQYFVAIPLGNQPGWLGSLASYSALPSAYLTYPLNLPAERLLGAPLQSGTLVEVTTPFGPAFRAALSDIALVALGTIVIVGLVAYLASGIREMIDAARY
jgi:hypothetical protein